MTIIVTGGAGFIGANFIFYMMKERPEDRIVCVDKLTYAGCIDTLAPVMGRANFRFVQADIGDRAAMETLFAGEKPDAVVNFAAESHVDRSIADPGVFLRTNVLGTQTLMDACLAGGCMRFHQVSTDEVYGDLPLEGDGLRFTEESPLRPSSPYAASKAAADLLALAYGRTYGLHVTISRCSNNYGPYQFPEKLIPLMTMNAFAGQEMPVYGKGENVRDWLHVSDHCRAVDMILRRGGKGEVYNIGGNNERRNIDLVRMIARRAGAGEAQIRFVPDRKGHDLRYAIDAGKLMREMGWTPRVAFEQGLEDTIRWYRQNGAWLAAARARSGA